MLEPDYQIRQWDSESIQKLRVLEDKGLARGVKLEAIRCSNPNDPDFEYLADSARECNGEVVLRPGDEKRGFVVCPKCNRDIDLTSGKQRETIVVVQPRMENIGKWIEQLFSSHVDSIQPLHRPMSWAIARATNKAVVVILDYVPLVTALGLPGASGGLISLVLSDRLYIYLSSKNLGWNIVSTNEILSDSSRLSHYIDLALSRSLTTSWGLLPALDRFVSRPDPQGSRFERFCRRFIQALPASHQRIQSLLLSLEKILPLCQWTVGLGGPGKPDLIRIDLHRYLSDFFRSYGNVECKSYRTTRFSRQDFNNALGQAERQGSKGVLFLVSTNDIEPWVWETVDKIMRNRGRYDYVVVDLELLSFLLVNLGLEDLLDE